ncbi:histone deacetylase 5-like isoform X2 [Tachypleus tridentatus]|uniref:histone deacetylase 5-like isoform X2 n=1 Tax=Tachypleus tridentatus TaxID=6853 RepID=UPI003FD43D9A
MDINSYYTYLQGKGMNGSDSVLNNSNNSNLTPALREQQIKFQQQLFHLKQQQQLQQSLLFQHFQQQQQQLVQHHEKQLRESFKEHLHRQKLEQQQIEQETKEKENLDAVRKKEKREQSAVASNEVKQRLLEFVLSKKQREAVINSVSNSPTESKKWHVFLGKYNDNFPFRKTENGSTKPDSGFGSPQEYTSSQNLSQATSNSSFDHENPGRPSYPTPTNGLNLHPSSSLPNISLGRPPAYFTNESKSAISDTQSKTSITAQLGLPLTPQSLHSSLPFYPPLPVTDGEFASPTNPAYIQHQMKALEQASSSRPDFSVGDVVSRACYCTGGITKAEEAQARLYRNSSRPLGRTQSAPLPLGHPLLQPQGMVLSTSQGESFLRDQQHNLLRQHIRQTVLTRASSKNQVENVEEETEAAIAQEMKDSSCDKKSFISIEAIDLSEPKSKVDRDKPDMGHITVTKKNYLEMLNGSAFTSHNHHVTRPLSRALSSPLVNLNPTGNIQEKFVYTHHAFTTGLVYDSLMLKHQCTCGDNTHHPEHGGRLQSVWARLHETGLVARCEKVKARKASLSEIQSCHSEAYSILFGTNSLNRLKLDLSKLDLPLKNFVKLPCGGIGVDFDTVWNELHTADAAWMAAGCVTELSFKVATGEVKNGFAVVRPPGHHAESQQAMGFCYFNSLAIAARQLQQKLKLEKILIVDWDIHHGNGLQQIFYNDPQVLYISLHRHDDGNFFPGTGGLEEVGTGDGIGYNVNIPWAGGLNPSLGDAEYIAAFRTIVMPIAEEFNPEIVLVAAGFDAAQGHPHQLGGYTVSPACFGYLTKQLMQLAKGKLVMALEGGYDLTAVCDCSQVCVSTLLGENNCSLKAEEVIRQPHWVAVEVLQQVISIQASYWPSIKQSVHGCSLLQTKKKESGLEITITTVPSVFVAAEQNQIQKTVVNESMDVDHK